MTALPYFYVVRGMDRHGSGCVEENVFLTERGLLEHMELNGHNYRHLKNVYPSGYVKHAFRNPEMEKLIESIMEFKDVEVPNNDNATESE